MYSLKRPNHWLWRTNFTREQVLKRLEEMKISGDWLICPLGEATKRPRWQASLQIRTSSWPRFGQQGKASQVENLGRCRQPLFHGDTLRAEED